MALFTDGPIASIDELVSQDAGLLSVAATEGIDVTKKLSLAMDEIALELTGWLPSPGRLDSVAVTPALSLWHVFHTLELVYRDAFQNRLNDRYAGKRDQFAALSKWAAEKLMDAGVGVAGDPLPKATAAQLSYVPGQQAGTTYYACICWTGARGQEGAAGEWSAVSTPDNNVLSVRALNPPANATGWNVYVGLAPDSIAQQNPSPLPLGAAWIQNDPVSTNGKAPGRGQGPDSLIPIRRILMRG